MAGREPSVEKQEKLGKSEGEPGLEGGGSGLKSPALEPRPFRFRAVWPIIRAAGLVPWAIAFLFLFLIVSGIVATFEPGIDGFGNACWLMFQAVTTIGFGDFTCVTLPGRIATILLSVYSVFFLALITGAVVSYCQERMHARRDESVARFIDQLEHLPELSHEELVDLSEKIRKLKRVD